MKAKQISSMTREDAEKQLVSLSTELIKLKSQIAARSQLKSPALVGNTKRTIARIKTHLQTLDKKDSEGAASAKKAVETPAKSE